MIPYLSASLPPVTAVEVVIIREVDDDKMAAESTGVTIRGDQAQGIADLWRRLPPGEQSRCHIPPFGLRFFAEDRVVCWATICWKCNNIHGETEGQRLFYEFDGEDATSLSLLDELLQNFDEHA